MQEKTDPSTLALLGGSPTFAEPLHVNKPNAAPRAAFEAYLDIAWERRWFSNDGPLLREFEARLAAYLGVAECVLTCNGTAALELTLRALNLTGEVILPSFTFISTANALVLAGLTPVFCDINAATMNIDCDACRALITEQTSAVIATHVWGRPCDTERLQAICDAAGIALLYDAAHAFGVEHLGRRIGGFGQAEIFSLHATKVLHAFEGGVISTNDASLAADLRLRRNFGFSAVDRIDMVGINAKMSEAHAAMGLANLDTLDTTIAANRACHDTYAEGLADIAGLRLCRPGPDEVSNYHYVIAEIDATEFGLNRDDFIDLLCAENILARRYFHPGCHRMTPYLPPEGPPPTLPVTEALCDRVLVLPAGAAIALKDVASICGLIRFASRHAASIALRLAADRKQAPS